MRACLRERVRKKEESTGERVSGKRTICFASHIELDEREREREGETVRVRLPPSLPIVIEVDVWVEDGERVLAREGRSRAGAGCTCSPENEAEG